jgi:hypothetical protein
MGTEQEESAVLVLWNLILIIPLALIDSLSGVLFILIRFSVLHDAIGVLPTQCLALLPNVLEQIGLGVEELEGVYEDALAESEEAQLVALLQILGARLVGIDPELKDSLHVGVELSAGCVVQMVGQGSSGAAADLSHQLGMVQKGGLNIGSAPLVVLSIVHLLSILPEQAGIGGLHLEDGHYEAGGEVVLLVGGVGGGSVPHKHGVDPRVVDNPFNNESVAFAERRAQEWTRPVGG